MQCPGDGEPEPSKGPPSELGFTAVTTLPRVLTLRGGAGSPAPGLLRRNAVHAPLTGCLGGQTGDLAVGVAGLPCRAGCSRLGTREGVSDPPILFGCCPPCIPSICLLASVASGSTLSQQVPPPGKHGSAMLNWAVPGDLNLCPHRPFHLGRGLLLQAGHAFGAPSCPLSSCSSLSSQVRGVWVPGARGQENQKVGGHFFLTCTEVMAHLSPSCPSQLPPTAATQATVQ